MLPLAAEGILFKSAEFYLIADQVPGPWLCLDCLTECCLWSPHQAALNKRVPIEEVELYFNLSDKVRQFTEDYFQLETPLYFSYSHLVCRTSLIGKLVVLTLPPLLIFNV